MNRTKILKLSKEQRKIYYQKHREAKEFFNLPKGWVLHHIDTTLLDKNLDRYIQWLPEDLQPMSKSEHTKLHLSLSNPMDKEESREKISQSKIGKKNLKISGANHPKAISVICIETNECFDTIELAVRKFGFTSKSAHCKISKCCKGERKKYMGYSWKYI